MGRNLAECGRGKDGGGGGVEQAFYSGISNGAAKSPCNFLSAGESARARGEAQRRSQRGHVIGRKRQKYAPIGRSAG